MNYNKLKALLKTRKISIKKLAVELLDMSEAGFHQSMKNDTLTVKNLERIAEILEIQITYFFEDGEYQIPENKESEIIRLQRELLTEKDKVIKLLETMNNSSNCDK